MRELEARFKAGGGSFEEYRIGDLFEVQTSRSLDAGKLKFSNNEIYAFVGRTRENYGVQGYIGEQNFAPNSENVISVSQIGTVVAQIRETKWYASQNIFILTPHNPRMMNLYFESAINKTLSRYEGGYSMYPTLMTLPNLEISLPTTGGEIDFSYMESVIRELEEERIRELSAYLAASGLDNTELSEQEKAAVQKLRQGKVQWKEFKVCGEDGVFNVNNTHSIMQSQIVPNSGIYPYVTASESNNSVCTYISYDMGQIERGNSIMIGGKTLVITYQESDYFSNDSHNIACYVKDENGKSKESQLFLISALYKSMKPKYSWGDSISGKKIQNDVIHLPITATGAIDWDFMQTLITAESRLAIRGVVDWKDKVIEKTKEVVRG